jgi:hypothetical protein
VLWTGDKIFTKWGFYEKEPCAFWSKWRFGEAKIILNFELRISSGWLFYYFNHPGLSPGQAPGTD